MSQADAVEGKAADRHTNVCPVSGSSGPVDATRLSMAFQHETPRCLRAWRVAPKGTTCGLSLFVKPHRLQCPEAIQPVMSATAWPIHYADSQVGVNLVSPMNKHDKHLSMS